MGQRKPICCLSSYHIESAVYVAERQISRQAGFSVNGCISVSLYLVRVEPASDVLPHE